MRKIPAKKRKITGKPKVPAWKKKLERQGVFINKLAPPLRTKILEHPAGASIKIAGKNYLWNWGSGTLAPSDKKIYLHSGKKYIRDFTNGKIFEATTGKLVATSHISCLDPRFKWVKPKFK